VAGAGTARVAAVVARHERTLLRVARQASLCEDDAHDAYQRALEIFLRRVDTVDPATELAWLRVVRYSDATPLQGSARQRGCLE
jgi:DNA-directed RNA polymerase specialized sigma24 family protein